MKVYAVVWHDYEYDEILGIYSERALAEGEVARLVKHPQAAPGAGSNLGIEEYTIDDAMDVEYALGLG